MTRRNLNDVFDRSELFLLNSPFLYCYCLRLRNLYGVKRPLFLAKCSDTLKLGSPKLIFPAHLP